MTKPIQIAPLESIGINTSWNIMKYPRLLASLSKVSALVYIMIEDIGIGNY